MSKQIVKMLSKTEFRKFIETIQDSERDQNVTAYPPDLRGLYSLYVKVRENKAMAVLEFGSGWSTLILFKALDENRISDAHLTASTIRHPNPYTLMTVDCSQHFQSISLQRIVTTASETKVIPIITSAKMTVLNDQACHLFEKIPTFTADFIYLDGPDCDQVHGDVNGMSVSFGDSKKMYGLPMAADLLLLEPFFWPGTTIITDGRGANAYFLRTNFKRNWNYNYDQECDQHSFYLDEKPWGSISKALLSLKKL